MSVVACDPAAPIAARYRVGVLAPGSDTPVRTVERELYREARRVLHVRPDRGVADHYALTPNDRLRSVRYFDRDERAIAYEPADLVAARGDAEPHQHCCPKAGSTRTHSRGRR